MKVIENNKSAMVGISTIGEHSIAKGSECHIISLVRDKLYPNPDKAALCETICNAIDEHRKHAVKRPVDVVITKTEVVVRDYANGLSMEDVVNVFFAFGASTKKDSDEAIGGFGIGAKAPSAYAQSWTVESRYKGKHTGYVTTLNGVKGVIGKLFEKDCALDDTGITVRFPLKKSDHYENFLNLAMDMYLQIGFFNDEEELRVYATKELSSYNDFVYMAETNPENIDKYDAIAAFNMVSWKNLRKNNSNCQYIEDVGFILPSSDRYNHYSYLNDQWGSHTTKDQLRSNFFRRGYGSQRWAYDGDMMYKLPEMSFLHTGTYTESKTSNYHNNNVTVLMIPKGKFQIAPSREALIASSELENYMKEQHRKLYTSYNNLLIKRAKELFSDEKNDFFVAFNTFIKTVFFPFITSQLPFYPTYDVIQGDGKGRVPIASYIISAASSIIKTRIEEEESGLAITDRTGDIALEELERIPSSKMGREIYSFKGIIANVAIDMNENRTMNTRIARAVLMWILDNMTETQKKCYANNRMEGLMVNIYHVEGSCDEEVKDDIYPSIGVGIRENSSSNSSWEKYVELFPPHTWLRMPALQPYLDELSKYIIEKNKEEAKLVVESKPVVNDLRDVCCKLIPESSYANTLLIAPSQSDMYGCLTQALREGNNWLVFAKALLKSLDIDHVAICAKANMRPYLAKGARNAEFVDLATAGYQLIKKHGFIFVPSILENLLNINIVKTKFYEQLQKEDIYELDKGMYRNYTCYYRSAKRLIQSLPGGSKISEIMEAELNRIQNHVTEVFNKLSVSDKIVLYDATMAGNSVKSSRGMLDNVYTENQVMYEKLDGRLLKLLEKAENILLNKFLPKLNLVWNPTLDCNINTNK